MKTTRDINNRNKNHRSPWPAYYIIACAIMALSLTSCKKEDERIDSFLVDFVTVQKDMGNYLFILDSGHTLIPQNIGSYAGKSGQRAILDYVPLNGDTIKIRAIRNIFTDDIKKNNFKENYKTDPIKLVAAWTGGGYLNLIFKIEYHNRTHDFALLMATNDKDKSKIDIQEHPNYDIINSISDDNTRNNGENAAESPDKNETRSSKGISATYQTNSPEINLYFSHSKNDDPAGYEKTMYASFSLKSLYQLSDNNTIVFNFHYIEKNGEKCKELSFKKPKTH